MCSFHIPQKKVVVASSFEGVLNNGAMECAFTSLNAFNKIARKGAIRSDGFFGQGIMEPDEFRQLNLPGSMLVKAFLALRPLVAVAEDYLTVLMLIEAHGGAAREVVTNTSKEGVEFFTEAFKRLKGTTAEARAAFRTAFYEERKACQEKSYPSWLALQEPYPETLDQLRLLNALKDGPAGASNGVNGFFLYYVTSKDEASTLQLCNVYASLGSMKATEVSAAAISAAGGWPAYVASLKTCLISPDRIIGIQKVAGGDKLRQMQMILAQENIDDPARIWRVNDRYDEAEIASLKSGGFVHYFISAGGYAFPHDYETARQNGIPVIERARLAEELSQYAEQKGF
jgi:hypothetical protein